MSAGHSNAVGNKAFLKSYYTANKSQGEKLVGAEFTMVFDGDDNMGTLIRTAQMPEMTREDVEDYGPNGTKFNQHGPIRNSGEMSVQCVETISGTVLQFIKDQIENKSYTDITFSQNPESLSGSTTDAGTITLLDCKIYCDAVDFSTEDVTALVRPSLRIVYNWIDWD
jgi:hypothetical protein